MAFELTDDEIVAATGAVRLQAGLSQRFDSVSTDSRSISRGALFVALRGDRFDGHGFLTQAVMAGATAILVNRHAVLGEVASNVAIYAVDDTLVALGALARFHRRRFAIPLGAVTGSNGKTSTKEMVAEILNVRGPTLKTEGNLNNEIGVPLTLFRLGAQHRAAVIEMGMNHAGEIARLTAMAEPTAGLITVVQPAHLEGLGTIAGVAKAKAELFWGLAQTSIAVVNLDDQQIVEQSHDLRCRKLTFGEAENADIRMLSVTPNRHLGQILTLSFHGKSVDVPIALIGRHNAINATAACALATALGASIDECALGLQQVKAHAHRLEIVRSICGATVIDDTYNANPASMIAGLKTLSQIGARHRKIAILGDMLELGASEVAEHAELGRQAAAHAEVIAFIGQRCRNSFEAVEKTSGAHALYFEAMSDLISWLEKEVTPDDFVFVKGSRGMKMERVVAALTANTPGGH